MNTNIFKDMFTGRVLLSIKNIADHEGQHCLELTFAGTERKLWIYDALTAKVWVDDVENIYNF